LWLGGYFAFNGAMERWSVDSLPWDRFRPDLVDPRLLALVKGASLVEFNSEDYVTYLLSIFAGHPDLHEGIAQWGREERRHGEALARWARLADPAFDLASSLARFRNVYQIPLQAKTSIRGSLARELVARCVVETGTSTFYTAIRDASQEPLLKEIAKRIAGDEIRHHALFLGWLENLEEPLGRWGRLKTLIARAREAGDVELSFAYFAANQPEGFSAQRADQYSYQYMCEVASLYRPQHFVMSTGLLARILRLHLRPWLALEIGRGMHFVLRLRFAHP
jgi:hypothetical protein